MNVIRRVSTLLLSFHLFVIVLPSPTVLLPTFRVESLAAVIQPTRGPRKFAEFRLRESLYDKETGR